MPVREADLLLVDTDDRLYRGALIDACPGRVLLYPHGALAIYSGFFPPDPRIDAQLVHGAGTARLLERMSLDREVHVIDWSYGAQIPFRAPDRVDRVLFGPIHPGDAGELAAVYREENQRVLSGLLELDAEIIVQLRGTTEQNGLLETGHARLVPSTLTAGAREIDQADLVVSNGTYACVALARGRPTVMFGQSLPPEDTGRRPWRDEFNCGPIPRYPLDFDDAELPELIDGALANAGKDWADEFVGGPFNVDLFVAIAEQLAAVNSSV